MDKPIVVGAVIYDPKVTVIWKIIGDFLRTLDSVCIVHGHPSFVRVEGRDCTPPGGR